MVPAMGFGREAGDSEPRPKRPGQDPVVRDLPRDRCSGSRLRAQSSQTQQTPVQRISSGQVFWLALQLPVDEVAVQAPPTVFA